MVLSDRDLKAIIAKGKLTFRPPLAAAQIGPASIDLRLGDTFMVFRPGRYLELDPKKGLPADFMEKIVLRGRPFILHPGNFVLASTREYLKVPDDYVVNVEGKSTLSRMGILVHTAGFVDPGFEGSLTLEVSNHADLPVLLHAGMYICQIAVHALSSPAARPYNKRQKSLYRKNRGPVAARTKNLF